MQHPSAWLLRLQWLFERDDVAASNPLGELLGQTTPRPFAACVDDEAGCVAVQSVDATQLRAEMSGNPGEGVTARVGGSGVAGET